MRSSRLTFFILGWVGMLLYFTQRWIFGPLIPPRMEEFHSDKRALGVIGAASLGGYMFTPIVAGLLSDRFGRKYTILFGIFGFSTLTAVVLGVITTFAYATASLGPISIGYIGDHYSVAAGLSSVSVPCAFLAAFALLAAFLLRPSTKR